MKATDMPKPRREKNKRNRNQGSPLNLVAPHREPTGPDAVEQETAPPETAARTDLAAVHEAEQSSSESEVSREETGMRTERGRAHAEKAVSAYDADPVDDVVQINTGLLDIDHSKNIRRRRNPEKFEALRARIRYEGKVKDPIDVYRLDNGRYGVNAGFGRAEIAVDLGLKTVPARVREQYNPYINAAENRDRDDYTPIEDAESLYVMMTVKPDGTPREKPMSYREVEDAFKINKDVLVELMELRHAPEILKNLNTESLLRDTTAVVILARLCRLSKKDEATQKYDEELLRHIEQQLRDSDSKASQVYPRSMLVELRKQETAGIWPNELLRNLFIEGAFRKPTDVKACVEKMKFHGEKFTSFVRKHYGHGLSGGELARKYEVSVERKHPPIRYNERVEIDGGVFKTVDPRTRKVRVDHDGEECTWLIEMEPLRPGLAVVETDEGERKSVPVEELSLLG